MTAEELSELIQAHIEDEVAVEEVKRRPDFAQFECTDDDGNIFRVKIVQTNVAEEEEDDEADDCVSAFSSDDEDEAEF